MDFVQVQREATNKFDNSKIDEMLGQVEKQK